MTTRSAIAFPDRNGRQLFGILHEPEGGRRSDLGVILLSPGVKMRVGPQRLYLRIAALCTALGLPVLRFDFRGLGDSEGTLQEELLKDVYNHIEVGRFVDDAIDAMNWMAARCGTRRFILSGLCGGAITGLLTSSRDPRVAGLLALGITPVLASRAADPSRYMTAGQLDRIGQSYVNKLTDVRSWLRLLTFQSDYRLLWRAMKRRLAPPPAAAPAPPPPAADDDANPLFPPAFFGMLAGRKPMLLVFGGADRLHWEFEEKFVGRHRDRLAPLEAGYQVHVIANANHVLSMDEWQREMIDTSHRWLEQHFAPDLSPGASARP